MNTEYIQKCMVCSKLLMRKDITLVKDQIKENSEIYGQYHLAVMSNPFSPNPSDIAKSLEGYDNLMIILRTCPDKELDESVKKIDKLLDKMDSAVIHKNEGMTTKDSLNKVEECISEFEDINDCEETKEPLEKAHKMLDKVRKN